VPQDLLEQLAWELQAQLAHKDPLVPQDLLAAAAAM
jgi:hypothetical protein